MSDQAAAAAVGAALGQFNQALRDRDPALAESFDEAAIFIGSEPGEFALGREALSTLLDNIFRSPSTVQFEWSTVEASGIGETIWFYADGIVIITSPSGEQRRPYRLTGVLDRSGSGWRWRLFHGSEPWISPT
jgi:ketosteroid isomerase-like protein